MITINQLGRAQALAAVLMTAVCASALAASPAPRQAPAQLNPQQTNRTNCDAMESSKSAKSAKSANAADSANSGDLAAPGDADMDGRSGPCRLIDGSVEHDYPASDASAGASGDVQLAAGSGPAHKGGVERGVERYVAHAPTEAQIDTRAPQWHGDPRQGRNRAEPDWPGSDTKLRRALAFDQVLSAGHAASDPGGAADADHFASAERYLPVALEDTTNRNGLALIAGTGVAGGASPIPEPATYAMLLAGLVCVAAARRGPALRR